jgi:ABC-type transporter Mla subunit MlaD
MTTSNEDRVWERLATLRAEVHDALSAAERAAQQAQSDAPSAGAALRTAVRDLVEITRAARRVQDREVIPLLAHADGWGPIRAFYLRAELAEESAALAAIDEDAACKPVDEVADEVLWIVGSLRRSLHAEDEVIARHRPPAP